MVHMCARVCGVQRPADVSFPGCSLPLFFEREFLTEPGAHCYGWTGLRAPPVPDPLEVGF